MAVNRRNQLYTRHMFAFWQVPLMKLGGVQKCKLHFWRPGNQWFQKMYVYIFKSLTPLIVTYILGRSPPTQRGVDTSSTSINAPLPRQVGALPHPSAMQFHPHTPTHKWQRFAAQWGKQRARCVRHESIQISAWSVSWVEELEMKLSFICVKLGKDQWKCRIFLKESMGVLWRFDSLPTETEFQFLPKMMFEWSCLYLRDLFFACWVACCLFVPSFVQSVDICKRLCVRTAGFIFAAVFFDQIRLSTFLWFCGIWCQCWHWRFALAVRTL